jgi:uncharacterized spore protein YtfJ
VNEAIDGFMKRLENESQGRAETLERLLATADAGKVFGQPVSSGDYTVITAAEVGSGGGFGSGIGFGSGLTRRRGTRDGQDTNQEALPDGTIPEGAGGGGGGGGGSGARPVAVIVIGPEGVEVRPIVDLRRLALTGLVGLAILGHLWVKMAKRR